MALTQSWVNMLSYPMPHAVAPTFKGRDLRKFHREIIGLAWMVGATLAMAQDCEEPNMSVEKAVMCDAKKSMDLKKCQQLLVSDKVHNCRAVVGINSYSCEKITSLGLKMQCLRTVQVLQRQGG